MLNSTSDYDLRKCSRPLRKGLRRRLDLSEVMKADRMESMSTTMIDELSFYESESPHKMDCTSPSPNHRSSYHISSKRIYGDDLNSPNSRRYKTTLESQDHDFMETIADFEPIKINLPKNFNDIMNMDISATTDPVNYYSSPKDISISTSSTGYSICDISRATPILKRALSASEECLNSAVEKTVEEELIGDFSRKYSLPLMQGKYQDLKSITPHTLARLLKGEFNNEVASYKVIDCRYPYEFNGGHIEGAINIYTKEQCLEILNDQGPTASLNKVHILIFHCEFSFERGPTLLRYFRKQDRNKNKIAFPALQYPEIYLLEGGYKSFFTEYSNMCIPVAYKQMLHPEHEEDLRYFRTKTFLAP